MKSEPLTEQAIQRRLNHFFASWKYNVDGLFVFSWESDKLLWTKAGYIYEFEIKISRSDFKADFRHKAEKHLVLASTIARDCQPAIQQELFAEKQRRKPHWSLEDCQRMWGDIDKLTEGKRMPNYFYYAVPEGLIQPEEVPPYAGLVWIMKEYQYAEQSYRIVKDAPRLHKTKYTDGELNLGEKFYYNWKSAKEQLAKEQKNREEYQRDLKAELDRQGHEMTYEAMQRRMTLAEERRDEYERRMYETIRNNTWYNAETRRLRHIIRELQPGYDFKPMEDEIERMLSRKCPHSGI